MSNRTGLLMYLSQHHLHITVSAYEYSYIRTDLNQQACCSHCAVPTPMDRMYAARAVGLRVCMYTVPGPEKRQILPSEETIDVIKLTHFQHST